MYKYSPFQLFVQQLAMTPWGAWVCARLLPRLDGLMMRWSRGRTSMTSILAGPPVIRLTTRGAKSGQLRTVSLLSIPDGDSFILVASNFGQKHYPAWYYNLTAHPEAMLEVNGIAQPCRAKEVEGEDWQHCFNLAASIYPGYRLYKERAGRRMPIFVLRIGA